MTNNLHKVLFFAYLVLAVGTACNAADDGLKQFTHNSIVEKERPELNEATKKLISVYQRDPSAANLAALRKQVEANYDAVIARKQAKLAELKREAPGSSKVKEMEEIVDEVVKDKANRIEQTMRRFTDPRLRPGSRESDDGYLPVLGAAANVSIAYIPVTNDDYARFVKATGRKPPKDWVGGAFAAGKARHPVVNVPYADAVAYCKWLTAKDGKSTYRLPTETEWELAAGHMPKDADFNNGGKSGTTPVDAYAKTLSACGAVDMWGNCWEMTSTRIGPSGVAVKGGSWKSPRMDCRTEHRGEGRDLSVGVADVGFRVIRAN